MKDSSKTECVNESSTAALCQNSKFQIDRKKKPNGINTVFVTGPKELIDKWSPISVTVHFKGTRTDPKCIHNGSAPGMLLNIRYIWMIRCRIILKMVNKMVRGWTLRQGLFVQNFVQYLPPPGQITKKCEHLQPILSHIPLKLCCTIWNLT